MSFYRLWIALSMEITLKLRFAFARHCDVFFYVTNTLFVCSMYLHFFKTLELRCILVYSNYLRKLRYKMVIF